MLIVVAEPEQPSRKLATYLLEEAGYRVVQTTHGSETIDLLSENAVDLLLTAYDLPDMTGVDLCRQIRQVSDVPLILMTAQTDLQTKVMGLQVGADDIIMIPFEPSELLARVEAVLRRANNNLRSGMYQDNPDAVQMRFEFPSSVKIACEQYLLYFVEFLRDVGIEASADLTEDAGDVLFSVTPKGKDDALEIIREALDVYLRLPIKQVTSSFETSIEVQRLGAQILHLQGQILLGNAIVQQQRIALADKDTFIAQQQGLIQQQTLTGQILVQSLQEKTKDAAEPLIGEIVKIKPWTPESLPIEFDLPEVFRRLKEYVERLRHS